MIKDFEDFLEEKFALNYHGLDDEMPDAFVDWLGELDTEELVEYANDFADQIRQGYDVSTM